MCITTHGSRNIKFHTVCYHPYYECARNRLTRSLRSKKENVLCADNDCPSVQCVLYQILNRLSNFHKIFCIKSLHSCRASRSFTKISAVSHTSNSNEILPAISMLLDRCAMKLRIDLHIILLSQCMWISVRWKQHFTVGSKWNFAPTFYATDQSYKFRENRCSENHPTLRGVN
jgi:hypothetical protein